MLKDSRVNNLKNLIKDSFRIRPNHDPVYVDVGDHLERLSSKQHQIYFGRRGSGKSCLFVHFKNNEAKNLKILPIYIDTDEIKTLGYPDVLIRLLLSVMESTPSSKQWWRRILFCKNRVQKNIDQLRALLNQAENRNVTQEDKKTTNIRGATNYGGVNHSNTQGQISEFQERKLDTLERSLSDFKQTLREELDKRKNYSSCFVIIDDYYLIKKEIQPDVIDYLHRLLRGTDFYLKIGTVRHRTKIIRNDQQTIGIELNEDIEEISLDSTLEDLNLTKDYLGRMLNSLSDEVNLSNASSKLFNPDAFEKLVIASGGVPRDFLTIFVNAIESAISSGRDDHIVPTNIWKAASSLSYQNKLKNLRKEATSDSENLERIFRDLMRFCIEEKQITCFLISQEESQTYPQIHELIQQLMDFKLIHVIEPDTSAASGRKGRFEAYTLDFSLFMEPRRRNIKIVEFWNYDDSGRRQGVREAPVYSLERARNSLNSQDQQNTEDLLSVEYSYEE